MIFYYKAVQKNAKKKYKVFLLGVIIHSLVYAYDTGWYSYYGLMNFGGNQPYFFTPIERKGPQINRLQFDILNRGNANKTLTVSELDKIKWSYIFSQRMGVGYQFTPNLVLEFGGFRIISQLALQQPYEESFNKMIMGYVEGYKTLLTHRLWDRKWKHKEKERIFYLSELELTGAFLFGKRILPLTDKVKAYMLGGGAISKYKGERDCSGFYLSQDKDLKHPIINSNSAEIHSPLIVSGILGLGFQWHLHAITHLDIGLIHIFGRDKIPTLNILTCSFNIKLKKPKKLDLFIKNKR